MFFKVSLKRLLIISVFCCLFLLPKTFAEASGGYSHSRTITIDHTKVGMISGTDQANFPLLISGTYPYLASVANGGDVTNANGYDIIFTSDPAGHNMLNHEIETYSPATGAINFWVKVPNLSHTTDTTIYLWYGNSSITTSQENKAGVWDGGFKGVWHSGDSSGNTIIDSTANLNAGTKNGSTAPAEVAGKIGDAQSYNGSDDYVVIAPGTTLSPFTISVWAKVEEDSDNPTHTIIGTRNPSDQSFDFKFDDGNIIHGDIGDGNNWMANNADVDAGIFSYSFDTWYEVTYVVTDTEYKIYIDGNKVAEESYGPGTPLLTDSDHNLYIGQVGYGEEWFKGLIDEVRLSSIARSSDWINTEYNNQSSPSTFYALGGAVTQFSLNNPGDMAAGTRIEYTVTRKDQFGNLVINGSTRVYLYGLPTAAYKKFYDSVTGGNVISFIDIPAGISSANFWYYDEHAATSSVIASDNPIAPDGNAGILDASDQVLVSAGPVERFTINNPGDMAVNTRLGYTVTRKDQFGNPVTAGVTIVYLYTSSSGINARFYDSAIGGLFVSAVPINDGSQSANFWYYDETAGTWVITVSDSTPTANGNTGIIDDADYVTVSLVPIVATRFVILAPGESTVNKPLSVIVQAQDANGNIDTTYQGGVTLVASGSATGGGLVNIINGVGAVQINDAVAENVSLSLSDTQTTGLDTSSGAHAIFSALPPVFLGGGGGARFYLPVVGKVSFSGKAYPQANLSMVAVKENKDQIIQKDLISSDDGSFKIEFLGLSAGSRAYALLVKDKDNRIAQAKVFDLNLVNTDSVIDVKNIVVSPTIGFPRPTLTKGDFLAIVGYATPGSKVEIIIDGQPIKAQVVAGTDGSYKYLYNTFLLDYGSHTISCRQVTIDGEQSDFSPQKIFFVTDLIVPKTDHPSAHALIF